MTPEQKGAAAFDYYFGPLYLGIGHDTRWWTSFDLTQPVGAQVTALALTLPPPWNEVARQGEFAFAPAPGSISEIEWLAIVQAKQDFDRQSLRAAQYQTAQQDDMGFGTQN